MKSLLKRVAAGMAILPLALGLTASGAWGEQSIPQAIGMFATVQGQVTVEHPGAVTPIPVSIRDEVLFRDIIETHQQSRTKALLNDDSILTVGEQSRVEITEHIYDPSRNTRSVIVKLIQGKVRALVNKVFTGPGSRFEIHTPTAVAAARGTYFVAWYAQGMSGVANIGTHGRVDFTAEGVTVEVPPGTFTLTVGAAPLLPAPLTGPNVPGQVRRAVAGTEVNGGKGLGVGETPPGHESGNPGNGESSQGIGLGVGGVPPGHGGVNPGNKFSSQGVGIGVGGMPPGWSRLPVTPPSVTSGSAGRGVGVGNGGTPPGQGGGNPGQGGGNPGQGGGNQGQGGGNQGQGGGNQGQGGGKP